MIQRPLMAFLLMTAFPAHAESFVVEPEITKVIVYWEGASVEREVTIDLPPGQHDIVIPGLPASLDDKSIRLLETGSADLVSTTVLTHRLTPVPATATAEGQQADLAIEQARKDLAAMDLRIAGAKAKGEAARAKANALQKMLSQTELPVSAEALSIQTDMIQAEILAALEDAATARQEAEALAPDHAKLAQALDQAIAAKAALDPVLDETKTLKLTVESQGGKVPFRIETFTPDAGWEPTYEFYLTTGEEPELLLKRSMLISQASGEDWRDIDLRLSTANPLSQPYPNEPYSQHARVEPKPEPREIEEYEGDAGGPVVIEEDTTSRAGLDIGAVLGGVRFGGSVNGLNVEYHFPRKISVRSAADRMTLALDAVEMQADVFALSVPQRTQKVYLMVNATNTDGQTILPGEGQFFRDGVLVGRSSLDVLPSGKSVELGFGVIPDLVASQDFLEVREGEMGFFQTETEKQALSALHIENLTEKTWPLVVRAAVPYSEQDELKIEYQLTPAETPYEGFRGRGELEWKTDLPAGERFDIQLGYTMRWPEGMILQ